MKLKFQKTSLSLLLMAMTLLAPSALAEVTAPVGYVKLTFAAESDTPFSLPMNRPKVYSGEVSAFSGNDITIGSDDYTASAFVYNETTQKEHYYILFTTGHLEGRSFDITANTLNTLTVTPDADGDVDSISPNTVVVGDTFEIRPHWTLNTLFPDGEGFPAVASKFDEGSSIIFRPNDESGINHSASEGYKYVTGEGWISIFNGFAPPENNRILDRNVFFTLRNVDDTPVVKNIIGDVPTVNARFPLFANLIEQDSHIAFSYPVSLSLGTTGLATNNNFTKATDKFTPDGDLLITYDTNATGYNLSASKAYFYVDGEGWYDATNVFGGIIADTTLINSNGRGFVIRKRGENEALKLKNSVTMPYNPFGE